MLKYEKFTGTKTYMFPNGALAAPETIRAKYPAVNAFTHIIETDEAGEVCFAILNLAAQRSMHGLSADLTEEEAIAALEALRNAVPEETVSAEERIAAALEYQNLTAMDGETK